MCAFRRQLGQHSGLLHLTQTCFEEHFEHKETDVYVLYVCEGAAQKFKNMELCTNHFECDPIDNFY